jgi:hypothetical protein
MEVSDGPIFSQQYRNEDYDYDRLRRDLEDEYAIQSAAFSGGFGFVQMCDVQNVSNEQLLEMARKEGLNLNKYKK